MSPSQDANRARDGMIAMISEKTNQWTLLVGMLPVALTIGAGRLGSLPLDARQKEELFLTSAQSLFGIAFLLRLRLGIASALAELFTVHVGLSFVYLNDEAKTIMTLTWLAWVYLGLTAVLFVVSGRRLRPLIRNFVGRHPEAGRSHKAQQAGSRASSAHQ